ncbi:MAG: aldose epimerase family protein [Bacteroidales bacterium]|nr:aldose epimerase family protein [Bacteroidales bacterium]
MKKAFLFSLATAVALGFAACNSTDSAETTLSGLKKADFESTVKGKENHLYVLTNKNGMEVCVTNFGARIVSIMVPNKNGEMQDVVLGFDSIADYVNNEDNNFGAAIGRYGNRIAQGKITIEGKEYQLPQNNYGHCLHGGPEGYHRQMWDANQVDDHTLEMTLQDSAAVANFPGNVTVKMTYTLTDDNELKIDYSATTDSTTILNLTNHSYFNLGDLSKDVMAQELMISADSITPIDSTFMTNGTMQAVAGTPFDFRKSKPIGKDIKADDEQLKNGNGYDHNFVLNTGGDIKKVAARAYCPETGIVMEVFTTEPGIQLYVGNFLDGKLKGKKGVAYPFRGTIVMETQHYPNSPNQKEYPSVIVKPGETYKSACIYKFSVKK